MAEKDFAEIAKMSERYNKDPKSRIFVQLADAYRKSDMIDEALDILQKGLTYHPDYPLAYLILGKCYFSKRQFEQAKDSFSKTLSFDPQNIVALRMLAQTCEATKDEQGQVNAYKGILAVDPFDAPAKEKLARLDSPMHKEPMYTLAMAQEYEKQGNIEKAKTIYENLLFTDPTDLTLQQKVAELKNVTGGEEKNPNEEKIEGLQMGTYFEPDDLGQKPEKKKETPAETPPAHPDTTAITTEDFSPANSDAEKAEEKITLPTKEVERTPKTPVSEPPDQSKEDEISELDILEPIEPSTESVEEKPTPEKTAEPIQTAPVSPTLEQTPKATSDTADHEEKINEEELGMADLLQPIEATEETQPSEPEMPIPKLVDIPAPEPEPTAPEKTSQDLRPPMDKGEKQIETRVEPEEKLPMPDFPEQVPEKIEPRTPEPTEIPTPTTPIDTEKPAETQTPEPPTPEEKEKPQDTKPEEDFQSFKDWLGGLLK